MAMDLTWILSAKDNASSVFDKVKQSGTEAAGGIQGAFSGVMSKFNLLTGVVGSLVTIAGGAALKSIVNEYVAWELSVAKLAGTMGSTLESASVLSVAMQTYGIDGDVMEKAALRLAKTIGSNEAAFERLGVDVRDANGNLRSTADIMPEVNQALAGMKAGTDRNTAAMEIYGKSWGEVRSLLKLTPEAMEEARKTAERLHLIVGDEGVKKAKEYKKNMAEIELVSKSLKIQLGEVLLPVLVELGSYLGNNAPVIAEVFGYALRFIGKTAAQAGETVALVLYGIMSLANAAGSLLTGNFRQAKQELENIMNAQEDYFKKTVDRWTNWKPDVKKSKDKGGDSYEKDQTENNMKLWQAELAAYKEEQTAKSNIAKAEGEVRAAYLRAELDSNKITALDYAKQERESAMQTAQAKIDATAAYLKKETEVFNQIKAIRGKDTTEYQQELAKHKKAEEETILAKLTYNKTKIESESKVAAAEQAGMKLKQDQQTELWNMQQSVNALEGKNKDIISAENDLRSAMIQKKGFELKLNTVERDHAQKMIGELNNKIILMEKELDLKRRSANIDAMDDADKIIINNLRSRGYDQEADALQKVVDLREFDRKAAEQNKKVQDTINQAVKDGNDVLRDRWLIAQDILQTEQKISRQIIENRQSMAASTLAPAAAQNNASDSSYGLNSVLSSNAGIPYSSSVRSYAVGTNYVPTDGYAFIHEGEAIVPKKYNPAAGGSESSAGSGSITMQGGISVNVTGGSTSTETAREIARKILPELQQLQQRYRRAV